MVSWAEVKVFLGEVVFPVPRAWLTPVSCHPNAVGPLGVPFFAGPPIEGDGKGFSPCAGLRGYFLIQHMVLEALSGPGPVVNEAALRKLTVSQCFCPRV